MNVETARTLCEITSNFYRENAASFSSTRHASWAGWRRCLDEMGLGVGLPSDASAGGRPGGASPGGSRPESGRPEGAPTEDAPSAIDQLPGEPLRVLDVACGNGRFLRFLQDALPDAEVEYFAVDDCEQLVLEGLASDADNVAFQRLDVVSCLIEGSIEHAIEAPAVDVAVCFGFFHHVPGSDVRAALLGALVDSVRPGGYVAASLWQFAKSPELAAKAIEATAKARAEYGLPMLDEGDYLLGWQNKPHAYRYCHTFSDEEVADLARTVDGRASLVARFEADGRTGSMNSYLVFRRL